MIEFFFFGMPIKTLGSLGKIRVGRVTGNTHIFFFWPYAVTKMYPFRNKISFCTIYGEIKKIIPQFTPNL